MNWFNNLNSQFDALTISAQRGQLERAVDQLRKGLYALEADSQNLLDRIPDERPTGVERDSLLALDRKLMNEVNQLRRDQRAVGADIRLNDGTDADESVTGGLAKRGAVLSSVEHQLGSTTVWDANATRASLKQGILAVRNAQQAATEFRKKLAAAP
ncbi:hypothetical protein [Paraburkholderia rhynchosiae]|uniref:Uncharacterized protein n=1 Tax=Paraburkholderia rhynchosiae TaxID=487049 RepID=A0ABX4UT03_9BURK|nr:hypothetical protein [Paraburkholderia rhynchosiae]PMS17511.1 hypothetical protein C0Z16_36545 [Paraburkholderia rhynchosiae]